MGHFCPLVSFQEAAVPSFEEENCKKCWKVVRNVHKVSAVMMRNLDFCLCKNKAVDQLCRKCTDQRLCFGYSNSTTHLLLNSEISSF